nr:MAG TPA: hypothetical protein [Caudoviricetes sp.]
MGGRMECTAHSRKCVCRIVTGPVHKLVLEREHESIQLQMDISVMRIQIVFPME